MAHSRHERAPCPWRHASIVRSPMTASPAGREPENPALDATAPIPGFGGRQKVDLSCLRVWMPTGRGGGRGGGGFAMDGPRHDGLFFFFCVLREAPAVSGPGWIAAQRASTMTPAPSHPGPLFCGEEVICDVGQDRQRVRRGGMAGEGLCADRPKHGPDSRLSGQVEVRAVVKMWYSVSSLGNHLAPASVLIKGQANGFVFTWSTGLGSLAMQVGEVPGVVD